MAEVNSISEFIRKIGVSGECAIPKFQELMVGVAKDREGVFKERVFTRPSVTGSSDFGGYSQGWKRIRERAGRQGRAKDFDFSSTLRNSIKTISLDKEAQVAIVDESYGTPQAYVAVRRVVKNSTTEIARFQEKQAGIEWKLNAEEEEGANDILARKAPEILAECVESSLR